MKWRLEEGQGEAIYEIGVEDNGLLVGLSDADLQASVKTLTHMAERWVCLMFYLCRTDISIDILLRNQEIICIALFLQFFLMIFLSSGNFLFHI